jgi:hypothetical protein
LTESVDKIPGEARPAIQSLLVALALLSVFIIGLVLEIIGSVFMLYEANVLVERDVDPQTPSATIRITDIARRRCSFIRACTHKRQVRSAGRSIAGESAIFSLAPPPPHRNERAGGVGGGLPRGERKADMLGVSYGTVGNDVQPHGGHYDRPLLP